MQRITDVFLHPPFRELKIIINTCTYQLLTATLAEPTDNLNAAAQEGVALTRIFADLE